MITKRLPHVGPNRQPGTLSRRSQPEVRLPYWKLVEVAINELGEFRYARVPEWIALSGGSLLVKDGASNAAEDPLDETKEGILAVARDIRRGVTFPPIIAATEGEDQIHVLLEGHTRASAYVRALERRDTCEVIVGYVSDLSGWFWY